MATDMQHHRAVVGIPGGLGFPESPRWHDGRLWFVDVFRGRVLAAVPGQLATVIAELDDDVSGLGFLPDGSPLVVSMRRRQVLRLAAGHVAELHADLSGGVGGYLNDMVVDGQGRAWVDVIAGGREPLPGGAGGDALATIAADGAWRIVARGLDRPNGLAVSADGDTLLQAGTTRHELVAWAIGAHGGLSAPSRFADTGAHAADGICGDADGAVWVAGLRSGSFVRFLPGGRITDELSVAPRWAIACVLGGVDRRTLFMLTAEPGRLPVQTHPLTHRGFVESARVAVPGAGRP